MLSVMFQFRPDVTVRDQDSILTQVAAWDTVIKAARLKPDSKHPQILRMCCVYLQEAVDPLDTIRKLSKLPGVESAFLPAERELY